MRLPVGGGFVVAQRHRTAGSGAVGGGRTGEYAPVAGVEAGLESVEPRAGGYTG